MSSQILVVDDEQDIGELVKDILEDEGFSVIVAMNGQEARVLKTEHHFDCILLDIWMPDTDGISLLKEWKESEKGLDCPVIMMSGHGTVEHAVEATRLGAYDFLEKPLTLGKLLMMIERALANNQQREHKNIKKKFTITIEPIGKSEKIQRIKSELQKISQNTKTPVLFIGEAGTGKSLYANYLHSISERKKRPFISLSAATLNEENFLPTFCGREKEGIVMSGLLEKAQGGTLCLQYVDTLAPNIQMMLMSLLEMKQYTRVNGHQSITPDIHWVFTTTKDLRTKVSLGEFKEDLFYQISILPIYIPSLREHIEDIPELLNFYVNFFMEEENLPYRHFSVAVQNRLRHYHWPGNIKELKNIVKRLLIMGEKEEIHLSEVEAIFTEHEENKEQLLWEAMPLELSLRDARELFEKAYLLAQFRDCEGNVAKLAEKVGMERTNLYRKLKILGIDPKKITED